MKIEVVVTRSGIFGKLARYFGLEWSHAALRCEPGLGRLPRRPYVIEAGAWGIKDRCWEDFIDKVDEYQVFQMKAPLSLEQAEQILAYAWGNVWKPYNYWWLLKIGWGLIRKKFSILHYPAHVCSSLVDDCFAYAGIDLVPSIACVLVLPDDLADSPLLEPRSV